ncbi:MAG: hypothetical protein ACI8R4_000181 [Paracoccaceae bacterium]
MSPPPSHPTLREIRAHLTSPSTLAVQVGVAVLLGVGVVLGVINALALDNPSFPQGWGQIFGLAIVIALVVVGLHDLLRPLPLSAPLSVSEPATVSADSIAPPLLTRLALDKRGALVSLSVSDHYVDVVTSKGREMILIRLGDAMRETAPVRGMNVHRSHWVAMDQVVEVRRTGETAILRTSSGGDIPVSRTYMKPLRDSGLLPKRAAAGGKNG